MSSKMSRTYHTAFFIDVVAVLGKQEEYNCPVGEHDGHDKRVLPIVGPIVDGRYQGTHEQKTSNANILHTIT
jgi:hypothetical protein